jgi:hypothetical protein
MEYRVYLLSPNGHIIHREHFDSSDDEAAIERANKFADGCDVELWQRGRSVTKISQKIK